MTQLVWDPVFYGFGVPRGDGRPILLIPGFLAGDFSMTCLGEWLRRIGYTPHYAGIPINTDCPDRMIDSLIARIREIQSRAGRRVTIVGHSKGGYLGRVLAKQYPDRIEHVVALGSPFNDPLDIHPFTLLLVDLVKTLYQAQATRPSHPHHYGPLCYSTACRCSFASSLRLPLPNQVRYTAVYSRGDGVVRWRHCLTESDDENIEVSGTHLGLVVNRHVYRAIGELLTPARAARSPA